MGYFNDDRASCYVGMKTRKGSMIEKALYSEPDGYGGWLLDVWFDHGPPSFNCSTKGLEYIIDWAM